MGFLLVNYPSDREVSIDGDRCGRTNHPSEVGNGRHEVRLAGRDDFRPGSQQVAFFLGVPTTFALPASAVSRLRDVAGQFLRESEEFQRVLLELRFQARDPMLQCLDQ
ncbi:MAG TPA: hypothetical protein DEV93_21770 [Chloroflexi bacterium]|jgi:hypothetical protein|nr:hypothetical protein [Chloroflexota bacterium]